MSEKIKIYKLPRIPLTTILSNPLPFKIPVMSAKFVSRYPKQLELGDTFEYGHLVDVWLRGIWNSASSEMAVMVRDTSWQTILEKVCQLISMLDQHDESSLSGKRPDFTGIRDGMLVVKCEAKAENREINIAIDELIQKFHSTAHLMFPALDPIIPGFASTPSFIQLHCIYFDEHTQKFCQFPVKKYDVSQEEIRLMFIEDIFKIAIWIISQELPTESFHLVSGVRTRTRNGHFVTLAVDGLLKEFRRKERPVALDVIKKVYESRLPNVEQGTTNCFSITISTIGRRLKDALRLGRVNKSQILDSVRGAVSQLHCIGIAHCDICVDNVFVNIKDDVVFLGDLEYCQEKDQSAPSDLRRSDLRARTAEDLDGIQLEAFQEELARL
jgi:hypothetical protein